MAERLVDDPALIPVLIPEDNSHMSIILRTLLNSAGLKDVREARDGAEAFERLKDRRADLILVDLNLEGLDGAEFIRLIRDSADSPAPSAGIVVVSAHGVKSKVMEARKAGADAFVVKPVSAQTLLSTVASVLRKRAEQRVEL